MRLYNTLTRQIEKFEPINPPEVKLYACGVTVYDYVHLGHLRKYTMDDVLIRTLKHDGFHVKFVQNVTDVGHLSSDADTGEDKLEKGAKKYGESVWDIAHKFEDYFWYSMDLMGNLKPDVSCRATDHIQSQIDLVKTLEEKGYTYGIPGDGIYFDTSKVDNYGELTHLNANELKEGARIGVVAGKKSPTDFALWKFERAGENRAMSWPSPWSDRGFPGWHIECSAMSMEYLGSQLDIHTGGIDHIPVHHTNEIVQSEMATGKRPFVKYWVHHNFLKVEGEKMSKSLGNFYTIDDVLMRGFDPRALRLLFMTTHYRSELNFTWKNLEGMQSRFEKLLKQVNDLRKQAGEGGGKNESKLGAKALELRNEFYMALDNDLDTPTAVSLLWKTSKADLSPEEKLGLLIDFDQILQLDLKHSERVADMDRGLPDGVIPENVQSLLEDRQRAREAGGWDESDSVRDKLEQLGYRVIDTENGQKLSKIK